MRRLKKLGIALVLALLLSLLNMVASVLAGPGPTLPTVQSQCDCPELNGETHYLYLNDDGQIVRWTIRADVHLAWLAFPGN